MGPLSGCFVSCMWQHCDGSYLSECLIGRSRTSLLSSGFKRAEEICTVLPCSRDLGHFYEFLRCFCRTQGGYIYQGYIALYCVLLYTQSALQSCGGGGGGVSPQPPPVCNIHLDDATAATGQRRQCAHHTPATGGEEREIEPIKWMGIIRRLW